MNGPYGEMLLAFPEVFTDVAYFDMAAKTPAGYGPRTEERTIRGVIQTLGSRVDRSTGNTAYIANQRLWVRERLKIGRFVSDGVYIFRLGSDEEWSQGGFWSYTMEKLVGNDGSEHVDPSFTHGTGDYA